jgi:hypothetical protein
MISMNSLQAVDYPTQDAPGLRPSGDVLADYYRCPPNSMRLLPSDCVTGKPGYFRFGLDTIGYGRLSTGQPSSSARGNLDNVLEQLTKEPHAIRLPFDPVEVIENLRRERYTTHFRAEGHLPDDILRRAYYIIRPLLRVAARRHIQRIRLRDWKTIGFPSWPVDTTIERMHQKLLALRLRAQNVDRVPFIWFWPDGHSACLLMTHDVESLAGRDFCSHLMDLNESFGICSAFQVIPEDRYAVSKAFLQRIESRGFEINIHDLKHDGRLYADPAEFLKRAKQINTYAREFGAQGFRSGSLYRNADWYDAFEFSYDMSLPNVAHLDPQRGGCCTVMPFFIGKIVELPLTCTQDYTLFHILSDYSLDLWKRQVALIKQNHGLISIIVHPDYIIERRAQETYKELLAYLVRLRRQENIWSPLPRDAANWWKERSQMTLVPEGGQWRVEGPGSQRARVAYASLSGQHVTYTLEKREGVASPHQA